MAPVVGKGVIITSNGALWKRLHNMMMPAFSWKHIRDMTGIMIEECDLFREALEEKAGTGAPFSMMDLGGKLVFDIIARAVFNARLHAQTGGSRYLEDLRMMIHLASGQLTSPAVAYNPIRRIKVWARRRQILKTLNTSMRATVKERLVLLRGQKRVPSRQDPSSVLDLMLREHLVATVGPDAESVSKYELPDEDMELILTK